MLHIMPFEPASTAEGVEAKALVQRLIKELKRPASGAIAIAQPDIDGIRKFATEVIKRADKGSRSFWGPRVADLNELCKIVLTDQQFLAKGTTKVQITTALLDALPPVKDPADTDNADIPPAPKRVRIDQREESSAEAQASATLSNVNSPELSPWARYTSASSKKVSFAGLPWNCPLLAVRRGLYLANNQSLLKELREQASQVKDWGTLLVDEKSMLEARTAVLPAVLQELAKESLPFPQNIGMLGIASAYRVALNDYANALEARMRKSDEISSDSVFVDHSAATSQVGGIKITPSFQSNTPSVPSCLSGHAADIFKGITSRTVAPTNLDGNIEACCHLVAIEQTRKTKALGSFGIKITRKVPVTAIAIIARRMAPPGNRLATADALFPGSSVEAVRQRAAVQDSLEDIYEQGIIVAAERIKRGTASQRRERERLGTALSKRERDESMQRESAALARIVVVSLLFDRGSAALERLSIGVQVPALAQDIMRMTGMDATTAAACAKASLSAGISQQKFHDQESTRKRKVAAAAVARRLNVQQSFPRGRARGRGRGGSRQRGRGRGRNGKRRGSRGGRRTCHRCGSADHMVKDCPQPAPPDDAAR